MLIGNFASNRQESRAVLCDPPFRRLKPTEISFADLKIHPTLRPEHVGGEIHIPVCYEFHHPFDVVAALDEFPAASAAGGGQRGWSGFTHAASNFFYWHSSRTA